MKTNNLVIYAFTALAFVLIQGCGGLGKMDKLKEELNAKVEPDPLIVRGDSIEINLSGKYPEKYFHKKVIVEATPVLTYEGGETPFDMQGYQGEDAAGNYEVIPYATGKSFAYTDKIAYTPAMSEGNLELRIKGSKGSKEQSFDPIPLAPGVITTPYLMQNDDKPTMSKDNFKRTLSKSKEAIVNFAYNSSNVNSSELKDDDIKALKSFIEECAVADSLVLVGTNVEAYASPEGEITLNEDLALERSQAANKIVADLIKKAKLEVAETGFFVDSPKGEDWDGFKEQMEASTIEDKNLILRVLEMYTDKNKREQEIKNIAMTYKQIEKVILPSLRRSQITLNYKVEGYTDEELIVLCKSNPEILTVEEILFSATLFEGMNDKLEIYEHAERLFPADYRGINNVGYVLFMQNKKEEAKSQFEKAYAVSEKPEVANNMGICARLDGDRGAALDYFAAASGAGDAVAYNKALVKIQQGDYSAAVSNMGSNNTFNVALAKVLNGDNSGAKAAIDNSGDTSGMALYLKAIIAARQGSGADVLKNLNDAIAKDASLKAKAMKDLEFRDFKAQFNF
jgi:tetratricopeptide (TPR) repeat protein